MFLFQALLIALGTFCASGLTSIQWVAVEGKRYQSYYRQLNDIRQEDCINTCIMVGTV